MKFDWIRALGLTASAMLALSLLFIVLHESFTLLSAPPRLFGQSVGFVINTYLLLDLMAIIFVLFASVACCLAMLTPLKKEGERLDAFS